MKQIQTFDCPIRNTIETIQGKWTFSIIFVLMREGTMRYHKIAKTFNFISDRILSKELREMERIRLVKRMAYPTVPPTVEYSITEKGMDLFPVAETLKDWAIKYASDLESSNEIEARPYAKKNENLRRPREFAV